MNFLKTFFITIILCNSGTLLNVEKEDYGIAYSTEGPATETPTTIKTPEISTITDVEASDLAKETPLPKETTIVKEEKITPQEVTNLKEETSLPKEVTKKTVLEEWNDHLATLSSNWDQTNNFPKSEWKEKAWELAKRVLEKDKNASEALKSTFFEAIKAQTKQLTREINNLINEFDTMIDTIINPQVIQEKKETIVEVPAPPAPAPDIFEGLAPEATTKAEEFPSGTELTSEITTPSQPKIDEQWKELLSKIRNEKNPSTIKSMFNTLNTLAPQLVSSGKKVEEIQQEYNETLQFVRDRKKLHPADMKSMQDELNRALSPSSKEYEQRKQREQEEMQERLQAEQQKLQEEIKKMREEETKRREEEKKKTEEKEMLIKKSLSDAEKEGRITKEQLHALETKVEAAATQKLATQITSGVKVAVSTKQKEAKKALSEVVTSKKAAPEQGLFGKAVQMVTDWWSGTTTKTSQELILAEQQGEIELLTEYLSALEIPQEEQDIIIQYWKTLQQRLSMAPEFFEKNKIDQWITIITPLLKELVLTYHIISIKDACTKIKNILSVFLAKEDEDVRRNEKIINKIETYLNKEKTEQDEKIIEKENEKLKQLQQKAEKETQALLVQQKIKDEENRIKAEQEKLVSVASSYKNEKQQWKEFLKQLSQHKQATIAENNVQTAEAIKKSHSLFNLATIIPEKKQQNVAQKLKQKFAVALLEQQKANEDKINIHRNMDQFNAAVNKWLE